MKELLELEQLSINNRNNRNISQVERKRITEKINKNVRTVLLQKEEVTIDDIRILVRICGKQSVKSKKCYLEVLNKFPQFVFWINDGLTIDDIIEPIVKFEDIKHNYCRICGKEIHWNKNVLNKTCSHKCFTKDRTNVICEHFEEIAKLNGIDFTNYNDILKIVDLIGIKTGYFEFFKKNILKCKVFKDFLIDGLTEKDIIYCLTRKMEVRHYYCPICGKELHVNTFQDGMPKTCRGSCSIINSMEKSIETCLKNYGVKHFVQHTSLKNRAFKFESTPQLDESYKKVLSFKTVEPLFSRDEWFGCSLSQIGKGDLTYKFKCKKCGTMFEAKILGFTKNEPVCPHCSKLGISNEEIQLRTFIEEKIGDSDTMVLNSHKILKPMELDIFLEKSRVGIEYNGGFWHSIYKVKNKNYHKRKLEIANKNGVKLLFLWSNEWVNRREYSEILIDKIVNKEKYIYDIKQKSFIIKEDFSDEDLCFLNKYSFLRYPIGYLIKNSKYIIVCKNGLNEIESITSVGIPSRNKRAQYELLDFSTRKINSSDLMEDSLYLLGDKIRSIIYYKDNRLPDFLIDIPNSFKFNGKSKPDFFYYLGEKNYTSRYSFDKVNNFTKKEQSKKEGYRVFDCGSDVYLRVWEIGVNEKS